MSNPQVPTATKDLDQIKIFAEALHDPVIITNFTLDPPGPEIVYTNPAFSRVTGYSAEEVLGNTPRLLQGEETDRSVLNAMRLRLQQGRTFFGRILNYTKSGERLTFEWFISPWHESSGEITHWISVQRALNGRAKSRRKLVVVLAGIQSLVRIGLRQAIRTVDRNAKIWELARLGGDGNQFPGDRPCDAVFFEPMRGALPLGDMVRSLQVRFPGAPMIAYLPEHDPELMKSLMVLGARAAIVPSTPESLVPEIIRLVLAGGTYVPWNSASAEVLSNQETPETPRIDQLTRRQKEILKLIGEGRSNAEIAATLNLKPDTVKGHVTRILKNLGLGNRTQAALLASRIASGKHW